MDEEDLDSWYEEKKDRLTEFYNQQLKKADSRLKPEKRPAAHEKLKNSYEIKLKSLHMEYEKKAKRIIDKNLKKYFFLHRLSMFFNNIKKKFKKE